MKRKALLIILTAALSLFIQANIKAQSKSFTIKGVIDTVPNARYFVTFWNNSILVNDTLSLDGSSKFEYTASITEPTIFNLNIAQINPDVFAGDSYVYTFWVEPGKVHSFTGKTGWMVKGARGFNTRSKQFELKNSITEASERSFSKSYEEAKIELNKKAGQSTSPEIRERLYDSVNTDFIQRNPNDYYSLHLLKQILKSSNPDFENNEKYFNLLSKEIRNTSLGKVIGLQISNGRSSGIGQVLPDFAQTDTASKMVKLSDYRGKYVLVDFWASWCIPCRADNPRLLAAYKKYASKGFEIISISLDHVRTDWLKAIQEDQLLWPQLSDLRGRNNAVSRSFLITGIPDNFFLDPNGVIIARKLRGNMLEEKIDLIFKDK